VAEVSGVSWEQFVQTRIFDALGMGASNFSTVQTQASPDHATPYRERDGEVRAIPFFETDGERDAMGPAGNIVSCAADMAQWLRLQTGGDTPLVSAATLRDMHSPHMPIRDEFASTHFDRQLSAYGLGWFLHAYKGQVLAEHGGNINGFSALTSLIPDARLGVTVLCNGDGSALPTVITHQIYDQLLGLPATDWNGRLKPLWDQSRAGQKAGQAHAVATRQGEAGPSHPLSAYVGEYAHPGYGVIAIRMADEAGTALELLLNDKITLPLSHYHYDQFEAYWETWDGYQRLAFTTDSRGAITQITTQMEAAVPDVTFVRQAERRLSDPDYLAQFVGTYEAFGMPLQVSLATVGAAGARLRMAFAGAPAVALVPYQGTEFQVEGQPGASIAFVHNDAGQVEAARLIQPGAVFTAPRR
jgi:CubicO group peptidase (beta-lactamase class C family)